jgi:magnesium chelatase family protein
MEPVAVRKSCVTSGGPEAAGLSRSVSPWRVSVRHAASQGCRGRLNARIPGAELRRSYPPGAGGVAVLERVTELGELSARGADGAVRVAWSIADLAGKTRPGAEEVNLAIGLRR